MFFNLVPAWMSLSFIHLTLLGSGSKNFTKKEIKVAFKPKFCRCFLIFGFGIGLCILLGYLRYSEPGTHFWFRFTSSCFFAFGYFFLLFSKVAVAEIPMSAKIWAFLCCSNTVIRLTYTFFLPNDLAKDRIILDILFMYLHVLIFLGISFFENWNQVKFRNQKITMETLKSCSKFIISYNKLKVFDSWTIPRRSQKMLDSLYKNFICFDSKSKVPIQKAEFENLQNKYVAGCLVLADFYGVFISCEALLRNSVGPV